MAAITIRAWFSTRWAHGKRDTREREGGEAAWCVCLTVVCTLFVLRDLCLSADTTIRGGRRGWHDAGAVPTNAALGAVSHREVRAGREGRGGR